MDDASGVSEVYNLVDPPSDSGGIDDSDPEFRLRMDRDFEHENIGAWLTDRLEMLMKCVEFTTDRARRLHRFWRHDWYGVEGIVEGFGKRFVLKYQRMVIVQFSILVVFAYMRLHDAKEGKGTVLTPVVTLLLIILSTLIIPYTIYICLDFLHFFGIVYLGRGYTTRYPQYLRYLEARAPLEEELHVDLSVSHELVLEGIPEEETADTTKEHRDPNIDVEMEVTDIQETLELNKRK